MMNNQRISPADIIRIACNSDFTVSDAQLHRWRSRGLIPRPKVRRLGRGRGTASFYPVGTDLQVIALCELLTTIRNLDLAAMALFFQGYPVSLELLKSILLTTANQWESDTGDLVNDTGFTASGVGVLHKMVWAPRMGSTNLTRSRGRLRKEKFETFARILIFVAAGMKPDFLEQTDGPVSNPMVLRRGLGIETGLRTWMKVDDNELQSAISSLASHFNHAKLHMTVQDADEDTLKTSRTELLIVWQALMDMKACFLLLDKRDALGLQGLPEIDFTRSNPMTPMMLLVWMHLRKMPEVTETISIVIASAGIVSNFRNLLDSHPKIAQRLIKPLGAMLGLIGGLVIT